MAIVFILATFTTHVIHVSCTEMITILVYCNEHSCEFLAHDVCNNKLERDLFLFFFHSWCHLYIVIIIKKHVMTQF